MELTITILSIFGIILSVASCYKVLFVIGVFKRKVFPKTKTRKKYAICIAARNESSVISNLIDSINAQDNPHNKLTIFLVADNCTDDTASKALAKSGKIPVKVYERFDDKNKTKGFALQYLFKNIEQDYGLENFDAYFIFDADNILKSDYISRMNEAFCDGNKIVTSYRNSKNIDENWISYSYATHWMRTCRLEHRGKSLMNLSCRIQGTGYMFAHEVISRESKPNGPGWHYTSFTEDRAFGVDAVVQNYVVTYCEAAQFYDEQPTKLKIVLRQRLRWAKGFLQAVIENTPKLFKNFFKKSNGVKINKFRTYDTFWLIFPFEIESVIRKIIVTALKFTMAIIAVNFWGVLKGLFIAYLISFGINWLTGMLQALIVLILEHKNIPKIKWYKNLFYIFMFPIFDIIGKWCMYIALFKKVEWKPIPHDSKHNTYVNIASNLNTANDVVTEKNN